MKTKTLFCAVLTLLLPAMAHAADLSGIPKIRDGDQITIGNTRIRLGGIDAPSADQLCLNNAGERWTCGVAAREALIKHVGTKSWTCHVRTTDRRGRTVARCDVDGEDIGIVVRIRISFVVRQENYLVAARTETNGVIVKRA